MRETAEPWYPIPPDEPEDDAGYEAYQHPSYREAVLDRADDQRKRDRENGIRNPLVVAWETLERESARVFGRCEHGTHSARCIRAEGHEGGHYAVCGGDDD